MKIKRLQSNLIFIRLKRYVRNLEKPLRSSLVQIVKMIFKFYLDGNSVLGILKELEKSGIKSPTGKDRWNKREIDVMLSNEKYVGDVRLLSHREGEDHYLAKDSIPVIIPKAMFEKVQSEKEKRSNVIKGADGNKRKNTKYSSKKKKK